MHRAKQGSGLLKKLLLILSTSTVVSRPSHADSPFGRETSALPTRNARLVETLSLGLPDSLHDNVKRFILDHEQTTNYLLELKQTIFSDSGIKRKPSNLSHKNPRPIPSYPELIAEIQCDANFDLFRGDLQSNIRNVSQIKFSWRDHNLNSPRYYLKPTKELRKCQISYHSKGTQKKYMGRIELQALSSVAPDLTKIINSKETCLLPKQKNKLENLFFNTTYKKMSCPVNTDSIQILDKSFDGMRAKVKMLLGYDLTDDEIKSYNPNLNLDYSQLPKLDLILVASLVFRADFYGHIIARLIEQHAARGTQVRILISDVITLSKDRILLDRLTRNSPNVKLQYYRWPFRLKSGNGTIIDPLHRTMHMKFFLTYSSTNPDLNNVILGGRNIHDGFVFREIPRFKAEKNQVEYGKDEPWAPWKDFEIKVNSSALTEQLIQHFFMFWFRDYKTLETTDVNYIQKEDVQVPQTESQEAFVRHIVSIPYKEQDKLSNFFAELIDSSQQTVLISTPYFRLNKRIANALKQAALRGVNITLITRIDLAGDSFSWLSEEVNRAEINKFYKHTQIYEYMEPHEILHSKILLIDDKHSFISSVNFNKRSFIHDVENGLLIQSKHLNKNIRNLFKDYIAHSRLITEKQKLTFWKQMLITLLDDKF